MERLLHGSTPSPSKLWVYRYSHSMPDHHHLDNEGQGARDLLPIICLSSLLFLPSGLDYYFQLTSHAIGTAVACGIIAVLLIASTSVPNFFIPLLSIIGIAASHLIITMSIEYVDIGRSVISLFFLSVILFTAHYFSNSVFLFRDKTIENTLFVLRWLMVAVGILAILGIQPSIGVTLVKPTFPFTEPSHYALAFTPLLIDVCVKNGGWRRYMWIAIGLGLGYLLNSLSLIAGITLAALISLPLSRLLVIGGAFIAIVGYFVAAGHLDIAYFTDRLDFGAHTRNLSALVYIQGWELITSSLEQTNGWGVGFQQLGFGPIVSPTADAIYRMAHSDLNLTDGGFVAAKIISEFGVFGLITVLLFVSAVFRAYRRLRRHSTKQCFVDAGERLALAILCAYTVDMFMRGVGYFTGTTVLAISAYIFDRQCRRRSRAHRTSVAAEVHLGTSYGRSRDVTVAPTATP